ncbi:hypothetical protein ENSA7_16010 [Enhygromyxa salina]|uniref:Uncharacterized protein n=1 Tax=Enhygromyxa salina TaxID=215803 RepID=A0A2S9YUE5_9BACT|nr:hypothetical protein ENSA7_16010 [Enhygromyxa salina]
MLGSFGKPSTHPSDDFGVRAHSTRVCIGHPLGDCVKEALALGFGAAFVRRDTLTHGFGFGFGFGHEDSLRGHGAPTGCVPYASARSLPCWELEGLGLTWTARRIEPPSG